VRAIGYVNSGQIRLLSRTGKDMTRHRLPVPALARWLLALGIVATLAANMAQGCSGPIQYR